MQRGGIYEMNTELIEVYAWWIASSLSFCTALGISLLFLFLFGRSLSWQALCCSAQRWYFSLFVFLPFMPSSSSELDFLYVESWDTVTISNLFGGKLLLCHMLYTRQIRSFMKVHTWNGVCSLPPRLYFLSRSYCGAEYVWVGDDRGRQL